MDEAVEMNNFFEVGDKAFCCFFLLKATNLLLDISNMEGLWRLG